MNYLDNLHAAQATNQPALNEILDKYRCQSVGNGNGYAEMITDFEVVHHVLRDLTDVGIAVTGVAWWCHCTEINHEIFYCPHGIRGPENEHGLGWFSEMVDFPMYFAPEADLRALAESDDLPALIATLNEKIATYLDEFPEDEQFIACLTPAIMLYVPDTWVRDA